MHVIVSGHVIEPVAQFLNGICLVQWHFCDGNSCPLFLSATQQRAHTDPRHGGGPQKLNFWAWICSCQSVPTNASQINKTWAYPDGVNVMSESVLCFHSRALILPGVISGQMLSWIGNSGSLWSTRSSFCVSPCSLLGRGQGCVPHISLEQPRGIFLAHRNAEGSRGLTCPSLRSKAPFPLDVPVVDEHKLCEAGISAATTAWLW